MNSPPFCQLASPTSVQRFLLSSRDSFTISHPAKRTKRRSKNHDDDASLGMIEGQSGKEANLSSGEVQAGEADFKMDLLDGEDDDLYNA
ncbi:MAG: hypothetical protein M1827_003910 [Pycnora praestabilis]|nr:MAG: hypothetical protein M1827_003910 [Pycnora praestabilis]